MTMSWSASFPGFASAHKMNQWLVGFSAWAVTQSEMSLDFVKSNFSLMWVYQLSTLEVTNQTTLDALKTRLLESCGGTKAHDIAAKAQWEALKMQDFSSVADLDLYFYAAARNCRASEEQQFAQYKKAMPASLKKSMEEAWMHPTNLAELKSQIMLF